MPWWRDVEDDGDSWLEEGRVYWRRRVGFGRGFSEGMVVIMIMALVSFVVAVRAVAM